MSGKSLLSLFADHKNKEMNGGGFTFSLDEQIAGHPEVSGYDDIKVHSSAKNPYEIKGGCDSCSKNTNKMSKTTSKKNKTMKKGKSTTTKKNNTKKYSKKMYGGKTKKYSMKKSMRKTGSKSGCGSKTMKGGSHSYPFTGETSDYTPGLMNKDFEGKMPKWGAFTR